MSVSFDIPVYEDDPNPVIPDGATIIANTPVSPPEVVQSVYYLFDNMPLLTPFAGRHCILGGATREPTTPLKVTNGDGSQNTLLMAHKGWDPLLGSSLDPDVGNLNDQGWAHLNNYVEHKRYPTHMFQDQNHVFSEGVKVFAHMGMSSPHNGSMPCLFGDGTVRGVNYNTPSFVLCSLWCWDDGYIVNAD